MEGEPGRGHFEPIVDDRCQCQRRTLQSNILFGHKKKKNIYDKIHAKATPRKIHVFMHSTTVEHTQNIKYGAAAKG